MSFLNRKEIDLRIGEVREAIKLAVSGLVNSRTITAQDAEWLNSIIDSEDENRRKNALLPSKNEWNTIEARNCPSCKNKDTILLFRDNKGWFAVCAGCIKLFLKPR